jgi:O-antigen/teichoic acid export membrane protein
VILAMGWGFNGPTLIAQASESSRRAIIRNSLVTRGAIAPVVVAVSCAVSATVAPTNATVAALATLPIAIGGLSLTWVFIGRRDPSSLFLLDTAPRAVFALIGVGVLIISENLVLFLLLQTLGATAAIVASTIGCAGRRATFRITKVDFAGAWNHSRQQVYASVTVLSASAYLSMPTIVVAWLGSPRALVIYALAERLSRFTLMAITPINQLVQGWVPADPTRIMHRIRVALRVALLGSIFLAASIAALGPFAAEILSGGEIEVPTFVAIALGVSVGASALSRVIGMACLLALHRDKEVAISAILGAAVGVPALLILVPIGGALGAASAVAISECAVALFQAAALYRSTAKAKNGDTVSRQLLVD